jgi:hypothetical protein
MMATIDRGDVEAFVLLNIKVAFDTIDISWYHAGCASRVFDARDGVLVHFLLLRRSNTSCSSHDRLINDQ